MIEPSGHVLARNLLPRAMALVGLLAVVVLVPLSVDDPGLREVVPWFTFLILVQLAPILFTRAGDAFEPLVFMGIRASFVTLGTLVSFVLADELRLDIIDVSDTETLVRVTEKAIAVSIVALGATYAGYYARWGGALKNLMPRVEGIVWPRRRLILLCVPLLLAFFASYAVFQRRVGVSIFDFTELGAGKAVWRDDPDLSWMLRGIELGFVPLLFYVAVRARDRRRFSLVAPALAALACGLLVTRLGQRGPFFHAVVVAAILVHYLRRKVPMWIFAILLVLGMSASNIMGEWRLAGRDTTEDERVESPFSFNPLHVLAAHENERQRFATLALIVDTFPDKMPYLLGQSWASLIVTPIPRWLWPEKNQYFPWQDNRIVMQLSGVPAPTPFTAVLWANLSWFGVIVGSMLMGVFYRSLNEWRKRHPRDPNVVLLYALVLIHFEPTFLALSSAMQYVLPVYLMILMLGFRRRTGLIARGSAARADAGGIDRPRKTG